MRWPTPTPSVAVLIPVVCKYFIEIGKDENAFTIDGNSTKHLKQLAFCDANADFKCQ